MITKYPAITRQVYGEEVEFLQTHWLRCIKLMGSLMTWDWFSDPATVKANPFLELLRPFASRVRIVKLDFFKQAYIVDNPAVVRRLPPRLTDPDKNGSHLLSKFPDIAYGFLPTGGFFKYPGDGGEPRTACDMCFWVSHSIAWCGLVLCH